MSRWYKIDVHLVIGVAMVATPIRKFRIEKGFQITFNWFILMNSVN